MTKTISIINYKGGVGKTTTTVNLAAGLSRFHGSNVLLIDADPQTNLTLSVLDIVEWKDKYASAKTLKKFFDSYIDDNQTISFSSLLIDQFKINDELNKYSNTGKVKLISSHLGLINVDLELAAMLGGANQRQQRNSFLKIYNRFEEGLSKIKDDFDYVLIDCPPNFNVITKNALVASDLFLIPTRPDFLSISGMYELKKHVKEFTKEYNQYSEESDSKYDELKLSELGVIFNMVTFRNGYPIAPHQEFISDVSRNGFAVFDEKIRHNDAYQSKAPESKLPVVLGTHSSGTYHDMEVEYKNLCNEFYNRMVSHGV